MGFFKSRSLKKNILLYDADISSLAFNKSFYDDIKRLEPFGTGNPVPTFLFRNLKIIKANIVSNKHVSLILKSSTGFSIKSIFFNSTNNRVSEYLLNYKKNFNLIGQITQNFWNNKKTLQLIIKDIIL